MWLNVINLTSCCYASILLALLTQWMLAQVWVAVVLIPPVCVASLVSRSPVLTCSLVLLCPVLLTPTTMGDAVASCMGTYTLCSSWHVPNARTWSTPVVSCSTSQYLPLAVWTTVQTDS
jgi:hypothetical protein